MGTKLPRFISQRRKKLTAELAEGRVRTWLRALIDHEKRLCGSMMRAVDGVAEGTGNSKHWVRRIIGGYGNVRIQLHQGLNVMRAYVVMRRKQRAEMRAVRRATVSPSMHA